MEQFRTNPTAFKELRKSTLKKTIPIMVIAMAVGVTISQVNSSRSGTETDWYLILILIPFLLGIMWFSLNKAMNRRKQLYDSYRLTIENDRIYREQYNTPTIYLSNADINKIVRNPDGGFTIRGNNTSDVILVPALIVNHERLEDLLSEKKEISSKEDLPLFQKYGRLISFFTMGLMAAVYLSWNKIVVGCSGTLLVMLLGYSLFELNRNKNIDNKTKRGMWITLLVILSVIGVMFVKISGAYQP